MVKRKVKRTEPEEPRINLRVDEDLRVRLFELAKADARSMSSYVKKILTDHVKAHPSKPSESGRKNR